MKSVLLISEILIKSVLKTGARLKSLGTSFYRDLSEGELARSIQSTIFKHLLIILLVFFVVPIGFLSWRLIVREEAEIHARTLTQLQTVADGIEAQLLEFLNYLKGRTQDFSSDGFIRDAVADITRLPDGNRETIAALNRHLAVNKQPIIPEIEETFVINLSAVVVASSQAGNLGGSYAQAEFFRRGQSETYISDVFFDDQIGQNSWVVSTPLTDKVTQDLNGVLINRIRVEVLSDITSGRRAAAMGARTYLAKPGQPWEIYLVNRDRLMITESRFKENAVLKQVVDTRAVRLALDEGREMMGDYESYHGGLISGATMILDEPGWVLVTEIDFREAFKPVIVLRTRIFTIIGMLIIGLTAMVLFLTMRLVIPIGRMVEANRAMADGDDSAAIIGESVIPDNELGDVMRSRNLMLAKLQEREQQRMRKLSQVVEQMSDSVVITDKDGSIEYVNPAFESITGFSEQEALGNKPWLLISDDHDDVTYKRFWKTIFSGRDYKGILISKRKNGELFYEERTITPILAASGEITHYVSISRDITKRVEAEEALAESENRYRTIPETATDAIITAD
ncbi:MAG: PAS domain S-box protein, partial [Candidatus Marinimicrobia bacterium]|nr:PAS domain S-box protein [Candidatus Neomarinimicrobiota bacterium]